MVTRITQLPTLRIDPAQKVVFDYKGKDYAGFKGDTIATALYHNGVKIFGRSLKYHRPRGLYSLDGECSNTCMEVDGIPNVRTENTLLKQGMKVKEQNVKGSAENDMMGFIDKLDFMMPAGFYYRTMHKPAVLWPVAMKQIRKAAGIGTISPDFEMPGRFEQIFPSADVVVIGGGPAGMNAALAAADKGLRVVIMESRPWLGGFFDYRTVDYRDSEYKKNKQLYIRAKELASKVESHSGIRVFKHASVVGTYTNNLVTGFQIGGEKDNFTERYIEIRAKSVVVAAGCIERPLLFENNERPGVMQVGCVHRLARTYGIIAGERAVFSVGHDLGLEAAIDLFDLGMKILCVADVREDGQNPYLMIELAKRNILLLKGWVVSEAHGSKRVKGVTMTTLDGTISRDFECDLVAASAGFTPINGHLTLAHAKLRYDSHTNFFVADTMPERTYSAGRMLGLEDSLSIEVSGMLAGLKAALECKKFYDAGICKTSDGVANSQESINQLSSEIDTVTAKLKELPGTARGSKFVNAPVKGRKSFICFDEDTTIKNIKQAVEMGFDVPELIKRFTSAGTGPGQGGIPGHNLPLYVAKYTAAKNSSSGSHPKPTNVRPPLVPTFISTYAGRKHIMMKRTPMDQMQRADGGVFRKIGVWERARYFSNDFSCKKEIENVRNNVGMLDGSTLGKFRIHGPDALKALQRVYVSDMSKVKAGRIKYSAMCNDDGCVIDDGVVIKLGENDYYFTTSTARAGSTIEWIRYHTRFDGWDFYLVNLTDSMGVINLSGPNARKVLQKVISQDNDASIQDVSNEAFPFSGYREFMIKNTIPVKAMRLGFVGELSYELHVPSSYMVSLWNMVKEAGKEFNIQNFGVEAQNVLRMEKCHIILGQESEQRTNLLDLGLGFLWDRTKKDAKTIGAAALRHAENDPTRFRLVGFKMEDNGRAPNDGALIVDDKVRGYVCTARDSFTLNEAVGMALVESHLAEIGTRLAIFEDECKGELIYGKVVPMPFYDPDGRRMKS
ncbi:MAG: (2Fe-2S)-binding protein [Desulfamplus sp.]|nr:(2Fe-2S)-binding protein [Desulfamplus sp.]